MSDTRHVRERERVFQLIGGCALAAEKAILWRTVPGEKAAQRTILCWRAAVTFRAMARAALRGMATS